MLARVRLPLQTSVVLVRPAFRCGALQRLTVGPSPPRDRLAPRWPRGSTRPFSGLATCRRQSAHAVAPDHTASDPEPSIGRERPQSARSLPTVCPGCGAHGQTVDPDSPGYYGVASPRTSKTTSKQAEDDVFRAALDSGAFGASPPPSRSHTGPAGALEVPVCERCHALRHHSRGTGIIHPSMQSIRSMIEASRHKRNHIYHVLDAADFPMSLIPNLQHALRLPRLRTKNRRSKGVSYLRGRVAEVSFIITRSDLLAPKKEQVDALMPYLQAVLRDALGRTGRNVRLGNVRLVSAHRGWWTRHVKEEIWERGGAGWMVGKANVGKSALFGGVFPKGRSQSARDERAEEYREEERTLVAPPTADSAGELAGPEPERSPEPQPQLDRTLVDDPDEEAFPENEDGSLLPPAQPETTYPSMPLVSALPGTTASPILIPFGNGKGELIDLPGVARSHIEEYVRPEHRKGLIMKDRVVPEQLTIRPSQSLLLGGLIRITPRMSENLVMLAYPFVPSSLAPHVTGTHKAIAIQAGVHSSLSSGLEGQEYAGTVSSIATDDAKTKIQKAGTFRLEWDVTKRRAGALTAPDAGKQKAHHLPFVVYSCDILIESVGWVELVCQVRRRSDSLLSTDALGALELEAQNNVPEVDIYTPAGEFVGVRQPMNAWLLGGPKKEPKHKRRARPRQTVGMQKRRLANTT